MTRLTLMGAVLLAGCEAPSIEIMGRVEVSPDVAQPAEGVRVVVHDSEFDPVSDDRTDERGRFLLSAPQRSEVHVVVESEGRPVVFRGETGSVGPLLVPDGTFFLVPDGWLSAFLGPFEGCPDAEQGTGLILGQAALDLDVGPGGARPPEPCSFAYVEREGVRVDACYLSRVGEGEVFGYDPEAKTTGPTGRFLIPGVSGGPWRLVIGRSPGCGRGTLGETSLIGETWVHVPEGGVLPRLPAFVPL